MQLTETFVLTGEKKASGFFCMCPVPNSLKQGQLFLACAHLYRNEKEPTLCSILTHFFITRVKEIRNIGSLIFWTPLNTSELLANSGNTVVLPSRASARQEIGSTSHRRDAEGCFIQLVLMHSVSLAVLIACESGSCSSNLKLGKLARISVPGRSTRQMSDKHDDELLQFLPTQVSSLTMAHTTSSWHIENMQQHFSTKPCLLNSYLFWSLSQCNSGQHSWVGMWNGNIYCASVLMAGRLLTFTEPAYGSQTSLLQDMYSRQQWSNCI